MSERPYEKLKFYQDTCKLRKLIVPITERFQKSHMRLVSEMRDAARSAKQNIREGYSRGSLPEFLRAIRISQGSLEELGGDIDDCLLSFAQPIVRNSRKQSEILTSLLLLVKKRSIEDRLISSEEHQKLTKLCKSALYMSTQYVKSMNKSNNKGKWKTPGVSE